MKTADRQICAQPVLREIESQQIQNGRNLQEKETQRPIDDQNSAQVIDDQKSKNLTGQDQSFDCGIDNYDQSFKPSAAKLHQQNSHEEKKDEFVGFCFGGAAKKQFKLSEENQKKIAKIFQDSDDNEDEDALNDDLDFKSFFNKKDLKI